MSRRANRERSDAMEAGKPHYAECGRLIVVGAARNDRWLCEYCLVIESFG
jgi:cobyrinic acid a,c-diamide synthase